ncbi:hypothetical protein ACIBHX_46795 [Nonomuraea sp. NPDC050536]|uniref:hypothetical protein n=1 Tax=Nonomuraea sp. NPDC050536 TaxID=3364366 RepID=UPI0037C788B7
MWESPLQDDVRQVLDQLRAQHGAPLYDYARTELSGPQAERAVAGALLSVHVHSARLTDETQVRVWLYALVRAHRGQLADQDPGTSGGWHPTGGPQLLDLVLAALDPDEREALDLAARHNLSPDQIALIVDRNAAAIEHMVTAAADQVTLWFCAVTAAQAESGCDYLADLLTEWRAAPTRLSRTQLSRHIPECVTCRAVPRELQAADLLRQLPIAAEPGTLADQVGQVEPLGEDDQLWHDNGFPVQARTRTGRFRDWEERSQRVEEDLWAVRPDESDPEASIASLFTKPLHLLGKPLKVAATAVAAVAAVLLAGAVWTNMQQPAPTRVASLAAPQQGLDPAPPATITLLTTTAPNGLDDPPSSPVTTTPPTPPHASGKASPSSPPSGHRTHPSAAPTSRPTVSPVQPVRQGSLDDPPQPSRRPTSGPSAKPAPKALPKPATPEASLSPSRLDLGSSRSGSFSLDCPGASCQVTSASGADGISVSGTSVSVSAKAPAPDCHYVVQQGTVTVSWAGTATGDGKTTQGTTSGSGTLTLTVSYKAVDPATGGYRVYDGSSINNSGTGTC